MADNVVIPNQEGLEKLKNSISKYGAQKLHILSDFDRTLTTAFVGGKSIPSLISILRDGSYLTPDYAQKAQALYNKYHPIEVDPKIHSEEKKKAMHEWWTTHFDLLIKSGLDKKDLKKVVESDEIRFRDGFSEFINFLKEKNIPLVIMSSSGLGGDAISMYLERENFLYDNIYIISNSYEWDEDGKAVGIKKPLIHVMNKYEIEIKDFPVFEKIKDRKNVILLGDSLDDVGMITGFDYDSLLKIGFLNENEEESMEYYKQKYDAVILKDSSMEFINSLLREIIR